MIKIPQSTELSQSVTNKPDNIKQEKKTPDTNSDNAMYHIVKPGETLYRIHVNYKVPISKLRKLNHLKGNYIKVGQKIRVK